MHLNSYIYMHQHILLVIRLMAQLDRKAFMQTPQLFRLSLIIYEDTLHTCAVS